jgi:hypothetical protein
MYRADEERDTEEYINMWLAVILVLAWLVWHMQIYFRIERHAEKKRRWVQTQTGVGESDAENGEVELEMGSRKLKRRTKPKEKKRRLSFKTIVRLVSKEKELTEGGKDETDSPGRPSPRNANSNLRKDRTLVTPSSAKPTEVRPPTTPEFKLRVDKFAAAAPTDTAGTSNTSATANLKGDDHRDAISPTASPKAASFDTSFPLRSGGGSGGIDGRYTAPVGWEHREHANTVDNKLIRQQVERELESRESMRPNRTPAIAGVNRGGSTGHNDNGPDLHRRVRL